jgi:ABC-type transport system substrate-binding protein
MQLSSGDATLRMIASMLQQSWKQAGINVDLEESEDGTITTNWFSMEYTLQLTQFTSDINDPDELVSIVADSASGTNGCFTGYVNENAEALAIEGRRTLDPKKRTEVYKKVHTMVYNDAWSVPVANPPHVNAFRDHVKGFKTLSTAHWWLKDIWLDK